MTTSTEIIAKAREFIGTPFAHQGRLKGIGIDCVGLVICAAKELNLVPQDYDYITYRRSPDTSLLHFEFLRWCDYVAPKEACPGDVLCLWSSTRTKLAQHTAFLTEKNTIIHSIMMRKVVETELGIWADRIVCAYRLPQGD